MESTLTFWGGAGSVTGSNFMLQTGGATFLIDCGLQQGMNEKDNWDPFGYDPASASHLIISHAHIDHIGRIPKLVRDGFKGKIISTKATKALAEPLLLDAMEILAHGAERHAREPLYEEDDIKKAMSLWEGIDYHQKVELPDGVTLAFLDAGHILGSAMARFEREGRVLVITGDLGGGNSPLLPPTEKVTDAHYLVIESVYGDRTRPEDKDRRELLENAIEDTVARGGTLLIPAFSTERTQDLMYEIGVLMKEKRVPSVPVYVDSPLARKITDVFVAQLGKGDIFNFPELRFVESAEDSRRIHEHRGAKIILAGSGMSMGGRVVAHEKAVLPDKNSTLLIVGYQSAGSLGRRIAEGQKQVEIHHEKVPVHCKVESIYGYSAHRDGESLLQFANDTAQKAEHIFTVEGEPASAAFLAQRIRDYLGVKATSPSAGDKAVIKF